MMDDYEDIKRPPVGLKFLPTEIIREIFCHLDQDSLLAVRYLDHDLHSIATVCAFEDIALSHSTTEEGFVQIAKSEILRKHVRTVHLDFRAPEGEGLDPRDWTFPYPTGLLEALPFLQYFHNLKTLRLYFDGECYDEIYEPDIVAEQTVDFRYRVLDTIFHCLNGTWSSQEQEAVDRSLGSCYSRCRRHPLAPSRLGPIQLLTLTIFNLHEYDDPRLTKSGVFKAVLERESLTDLGLLFAAQDLLNGEYEAEYGIDYWKFVGPYVKNRHNMFQNLHCTWMSATVSENLIRLDLGFRQGRGWFLSVNLGATTPALPNLRRLTLRGFYFSHKEQGEWIASLGKKGSSGGLRELYLDNCRILHHAQYTSKCLLLGDDSPIDENITYDEDSLNVEAILPFSLPVNSEKELRYDNPLRWHMILNPWCESMPSLEIFQMGAGMNDGDPVFNLSTHRKHQLLYVWYLHSPGSIFEAEPVVIREHTPSSYWKNRLSKTVPYPSLDGKAEDEAALELLASTVGSRYWFSRQ